MVDKSVKVEGPLVVDEGLTSSSGHSKSYLWPALPALLFALSIAGVWVGDFHQAYEMPNIVIGLNLAFSVLVSLAVAALTGRGFLRSGAPVLLFLSAASIIWGLAGFVAGIVSHSRGVGGEQDANLLITIHNICVWISSLCHLIGLSFKVRWRQPSWVLRVWLCSSYALALAIIGLVTQAAISGWFPIFFVPGMGGTAERQFLLGATIFTFGLTGAILLSKHHVQFTSFARWYGFSLLLLAVGLLGVMLQLTPGDVMSWTGRMSQFLGGAYMLVAALKCLDEPAAPEYVMLRKGRVFWSKYSFAAVLMINAGALRLGLMSSLGPTSGYLVFYPAVIISALYGGPSAGFFAAVIAFPLFQHLATEETGNLAGWHPIDLVHYAIFFVSSLAIVWLTAHTRRTERRASVAEAKANYVEERERILKNLYRSETRFRLLVEQAADGIFMSDDQGHYREVNEAGARMLGYSRSEIKAMKISDVILPEEVARLPQEISRFANGNVTTSEWRFRRKNGTVFLGEVTGRQLPDGMLLAILRDITELRLAEKSLKESENRFRTMANASFEGIVVTSRGNILDMNDQFLRMVGYEQQELVGHPVIDLIAPEARDSVMANMLNGLQSDVEHDILRKDGARRRVEAHGRMVEQEGGSVRLTAIRDITEQKQIESELRLERGLLKAIMDTTDAMLVCLDRNFDFLWVNNSYAKTCNMNPEDMIGKNHFSLYPNVENEAIFRQVRDTGRAIAFKDKPFEFLDQPERGKTYWDWSLTPELDQGGQTISLVFTLLETTDHVRIRQRAQESEGRFAAIADTVPVLIWMSDRDKQLTWVNQAWLSFTGRTMEQERGSGWIKSLHPEDGDHFLRQLNDCFEQREEFTMDCRMQTAGGAYRWLSGRAVPRYNNDRAFLGYVGVFADVSDARESQEQLRIANKQLAQVARERAAHLLELSKELTLAEQREQDRLYVRLHDHVQPLLIAARLKLSALNAKTAQEKSLEVVVEVCELISQVIQTTRNLSLHLNPPMIRNGGLGQALTSLCGWMRSTYGLKIALHCAPGIEPVDFVIRSLCFNAIREVLMNVVKYAGTEHVSIDLEAEDGDLLRVVVEDKGAGFDDQTRQHGSGLDNIQRRLEMVGGSLNIHSEIGVGTVVTLRAPLGVAPNHQPMEDGGRHGIQFFRPTADSHSLKFVSNIGKQGG